MNEFSSLGIIYDHIGCTPTLTLPRKRGRGLRGTGEGDCFASLAMTPSPLGGGLWWGQTKITP